MPVTSIKAAARSCPYFTLLIALGLGPCSAGALASSNITKRIHYFDVGFSGSAIGLMGNSSGKQGGLGAA